MDNFDSTGGGTSSRANHIVPGSGRKGTPKRLPSTLDAGFGAIGFDISEANNVSKLIAKRNARGRRLIAAGKRHFGPGWNNRGYEYVGGGQWRIYMHNVDTGEYGYVDTLEEKIGEVGRLASRVKSVRLSEMKTADEVLAEDLEDLEFREEWERLHEMDRVELKKKGCKK